MRFFGGLWAYALEKAKQGLSFEWRLVCPAGTGAFLYCSLGRLRGERLRARLRADALKKTKQGLSLERWLLCPAGTGALLCFSLGRLRGGVA